MPSLSAGLLLGAALLYALPQAFESAADKRGLCATLLAGLLSFFLLEKWATLRRARPLSTRLAGHGAYPVADAILIAAAFSAGLELGLLAAPAIGVHASARAAGSTDQAGQRAKFGNLLCNSLAAVVGLAGYFAFERPLAWMPYVLVLAASGFLYIVLSELVPQIQQPASHRDTALQLLLLGIGVTAVLYLPGLGASS